MRARTPTVLSEVQLAVACTHARCEPLGHICVTPLRLHCVGHATALNGTAARLTCTRNTEHLTSFEFVVIQLRAPETAAVASGASACASPGQQRTTMPDPRECDPAADPYVPSAATARLRQQTDDARNGAPRANSDPHQGPYVVELRQWRHATHSEGASSPKHSHARKSNMRSLDPGVLAPRASDRMLQRYRLLDHQTLFRDRIFDDSDWAYHSSSWRYILEPKVLLKVLAALVLPLCLVLGVAVGCALYQGLRAEEQPDLRELDLQFAYSLVSFALSLLLVFKTNTSYARFWEGAPTPRAVVDCLCQCFRACAGVFALEISRSPHLPPLGLVGLHRLLLSVIRCLMAIAVCNAVRLSARLEQAGHAPPHASCTSTARHRFAARTAWGATYTHCRTLLARFQGYAHDAPLPMRKLILRWIIALPYLMRSHLADYKPGSDSLEHLLTESEVRVHPGLLHNVGVYACVVAAVAVTRFTHFAAGFHVPPAACQDASVLCGAAVAAVPSSDQIRGGVCTPVHKLRAPRAQHARRATSIDSAQRSVADHVATRARQGLTRASPATARRERARSGNVRPEAQGRHVPRHRAGAVPRRVCARSAPREGTSPKNTHTPR